MQKQFLDFQSIFLPFFFFFPNTTFDSSKAKMPINKYSKEGFLTCKISLESGAFFFFFWLRV